MPNAALHFLLAGRVLRRWERRPLEAPFEPGPGTTNAFLHGALAPDMGFFPGADPLLSRLAHHARTGALCRALAGGARTDVERAFAWGWVTHVLADVAVHPLVNEACGERLAGSRDTPLWGAAAGAMHVRVEMGLDAVIRARHPELAGLRLRPALDARGAAFVARAFRRVYGAAPSVRTVLHAHCRVCFVSGPLALLRRVAGRALDDRPGAERRMASAPIRAVAAAMPAGSQAWGLFSPVRPAAWMLAEVEDVLENFADWFAGHFASDLQFLRDHCLDTGEVLSADTPDALAAMAELRARRMGDGTSIDDVRMDASSADRKVEVATAA